MLKKRDIFILKVLDKVTLATNIQLMILCGYRDPTVIRKKLKSLIEQGYIQSDWLGESKAYTLTKLGLAQIEKSRRAYEIKGIKSEHELLVTEAACLIYTNTGKSVFDMVFDREMASLKNFRDLGHRPDICFSSHQAVEVEITPKKLYGTSEKSGLTENFRSNVKNFSAQIWVVPGHRQAMIKSLRNLAETYGVKDRVKTITVDEMISVVKAYDIKTNCPRMEPVKGIPLPLNKQEGVVNNDKDR